MERHHCGSVRPIGEQRQSRSPAEAPLVYTVAEVAERLKVSAGTVRNMIDQGQLYAIRLHVRRTVIPKWALDELVGRPSSVMNIGRYASNA